MRSHFRGLWSRVVFSGKSGVWSGRLVLCGLLWLGLQGACQTNPPPAATPDDAGTASTDLQMPAVTVGLWQDCSSKGVGYGDVLCDQGLRCSVVLVGDAPSQGALLQCVPVPKPEETIKDGMPCALDQEHASPTEPTKHFDRCGDGFACVPTPSQGLRCKRLCQLRNRSACGKTELCVAPAQVTGVGFCSKPDACQPVWPQSGCPRGTDGQQLACYVLGDTKGTATFCLPQLPYGDGNGALDAPCERTWHCQAGLACIAPSGGGAVCRPYCALPTVPDGGTPPDLGTGEVLCSGNLGTCHPIADYESVGRCY